MILPVANLGLILTEHDQLTRGTVLEIAVSVSLILFTILFFLLERLVPIIEGMYDTMRTLADTVLRPPK